MKILTVDDNVTCMGQDNEPSVEVEVTKLTKEELNRFVIQIQRIIKLILNYKNMF